MTISVALCTYNGEKFIREQLDSILDQTKKADEIIVCDDGSTDSTLSILEEYQNKFPDVIKISRNERNLRSVKNFEKAIALCTKELIFLSDQDDIWERNKIQQYSDYLEKHAEISVVCSNGFIINTGSQKLDQYTVWDVPAFLKEKKYEVNYGEIISFVSNIATGASMAIRKDFIKSILPFPEVKGFHHDEWIALIAANQNKFGFLDDKLFSYRYHEDQQVGGVFVEKNEQEKNALLEKFQVNTDAKSTKAKLSFLKRLKRREKKLQEVYLFTHHTAIQEYLQIIQIKKTEATQQLRSHNFSLFILYKLLGKI
ncbi:glycosyltransferase family 2 protein [Chryseobacterium sp. Tr-659]|uniref:glycosyltransferase family 2 protein n=1 Tax=Chryseobacterium sp. Tr-659 TaxID=2608340 RepID=UPI001420EBF4|nr:glycosyltransferase family 2 protein [Chryseobacterium sp. Tr-659]NIF07910.1 glycosyltransferase family 2 protein [Chryseobacterium sp. Tr-659]